MSHIGKLPINIENGVEILVDGREVTVKGTKGELSWTLPKGIDLEVGKSSAKVKMKKDDVNLLKYYGLSRSIIANMVQGVSKGFDKKLEMAGVGYRAKLDGRSLVLNVGFSHPVKIDPPEDVTLQVEEGVITVSGVNKQTVGDVASKIRAVRPPEPYRGKGIKYVGEKIRRKAGKAAKSA